MAICCTSWGLLKMSVPLNAVGLTLQSASLGLYCTLQLAFSSHQAMFLLQTEEQSFLCVLASILWPCRRLSNVTSCPHNMVTGDEKWTGVIRLGMQPLLTYLTFLQVWWLYLCALLCLFICLTNQAKSFVLIFPFTSLKNIGYLASRLFPVFRCNWYQWKETRILVPKNKTKQKTAGLVFQAMRKWLYT